MTKTYNSLTEKTEVFDNGLVRTRSMLPMTRRNFVTSGVAAGAAAACVSISIALDARGYLTWNAFGDAAERRNSPRPRHRC